MSNKKFRIPTPLQRTQGLESVATITNAFLKFDFQKMLDQIIKTIISRIPNVFAGGVFLIEGDKVILVTDIGATTQVKDSVQIQKLFPGKNSLRAQKEGTIIGLAAQTVLKEKTIVINDTSELNVSSRAQDVVDNLGITNILSIPGVAPLARFNALDSNTTYSALPLMCGLLLTASPLSALLTGLTVSNSVRPDGR